MAKGVDVAIVGAGIVGVSAAAFLAESGLSVTVLERAEIGSAASGRNSGAIQHPFDAHLARLHSATLELYRELAGLTDFQLPPAPVGLLLLHREESAVRQSARSISERAPELEPTVMGPNELSVLEPALDHDLYACRLETGYPLPPSAAVQAFARRAARAGVRFVTGAGTVRLITNESRVEGVRMASGAVITAGQVLVAAGPWTARLIPGWHVRPPIRSLWGIVVSTVLDEPPAHVLEELGIDHGSDQPEELFSLVTAGHESGVGSTFLESEPVAEQRAGAILARAERFVPSLRTASIDAVRSCARPVAFDGRPLIGAVPGLSSLFVCAGHGAWGISTGPASARLVVDVMLGRATGDATFDPGRIVTG